MKIYQETIILWDDPFWENISSEPEARIEETIGSILF